MAKHFYHFVGGCQVCDWQINEWIRQALSKIESGACHHSISSGDTMVIAMKYPTEIQVVVSNDSGRSMLTFSTSSGDPLVFEEYVRPILSLV